MNTDVRPLAFVRVAEQSLDTTTPNDHMLNSANPGWRLAHLGEARQRIHRLIGMPSSSCEWQDLAIS
jgi:hypothetical protein